MHMRTKFLLAFLCLAACSGASSNGAARADLTLLRGASVVDVNGEQDGVRDILLRDGRIEAVGPRGEIDVPAGTSTVDADGLYAIPGLWDMHVHVTGVPEIEDRIFALLVANGITSVRDMGGLLEPVLAARERSKKPGAIAPRLFIAGTIIDGTPPVYSGGGVKETSVVADTPEEAIARVDRLAAAGVDMIKPYEMLRPEPFRALVERADYHGLPATGHVPIHMTVGQTLDAGLDGIEHLRGIEFDCAENPEKLLEERTAMMDAHEGDSGGYELRRSVHATVRPKALAHQDPERCAALIRRFVDAGTWHTPTLHFLGFRALGLYRNPDWLKTYRYLPPDLQERRLALLKEFTDETKYVEWADHGRWAVDILGRMHDAGVKILAGTDSPGFIFMPGFTLHDELEALVTAGLSEREALKAATASPAEFFNVSDDTGSIEAGKRADLVLLEADPLEDIRNTRRIAAVVIEGRVIDRQGLDALLAPFESPVE
jgi:imidazolonepropionase-like amidohydrolase